MADSAKATSAKTAAGTSPAPANAHSKAIQADWMAALHPGFRGDAGRSTPVHNLIEPARPAMHQSEIEKQSPHGGSAGQETKLTIGSRPAADAASFEQVKAAPTALDGFCPVELVKNERWVRGDMRWSAVYQGRTYLFSTRVQRQQFLAEPQRFVPAFSGSDPVLLAEEKRPVPGQTDYCVTYQGRLYMFSSMTTLAQFQNNPQPYARSASQ